MEIDSEIAFSLAQLIAEPRFGDAAADAAAAIAADRPDERATEALPYETV